MIKKIIGALLMLCGTLLIGCAVYSVVNNINEELDSEKASAEIVEKLSTYINQTYESVDETSGEESLDEPGDIIFEPPSYAMPTVEIDGYDYIGYLSIPSVDIELPITADWDYDRMSIGACRYDGSYLNDTLIIVGHNYRRQLGLIASLNTGDTVCFTDVNNRTHIYYVVETEIMKPVEVDKMISSGYDLTLFTCTRGAVNRLAVRCLRVQQ